MKKYFFLVTFIAFQISFSEIGKCQAIVNLSDTLHQKIDTSSKVEDKIIDEVIESKKPIKKEKVSYLTQVTQYGFKDLFKNYSYNSAIPYASQVDPHAEKYMQDYLNSHEAYLLNLKKTAVPYFNLIDGILTKYGLPRELKYLAVIESDLKINALSIAGARGPWQFMIYTAKDYGLVVNDQEDERTDYYKSTNAAAKYLLYLYKNLKDWLLVIAAYNGGPGKVYSAIQKSGSRNFWNLQYYLPEESRNHVKKFIATHYIMEAGNKDNLPSSQFNYSSLSNDTNGAQERRLTASEKQNADSVEVSGRYNAGVIAKNVSMDISDFNRYNPGFDNMLATGASYHLLLPNEKIKEFQDKKYQILNESVERLLRGVETNFKNSNQPKNPVTKMK
jgi:membrane-bound lytic murein transglycosylase D